MSYYSTDSKDHYYNITGELCPNDVEEWLADPICCEDFDGDSRWIEVEQDLDKLDIHQLLLEGETL